MSMLYINISKTLLSFYAKAYFRAFPNLFVKLLFVIQACRLSKTALFREGAGRARFPLMRLPFCLDYSFGAVIGRGTGRLVTDALHLEIPLLKQVSQHRLWVAVPIPIVSAYYAVKCQNASAPT